MAVVLNHTDLRVLNSLVNRCDHCQVVLQRDLADQLYYSREHITRILQRLEYLGVIRRQRLLTRQGRPYIYEVSHVLSDASPGVLD